MLADQQPTTGERDYGDKRLSANWTSNLRRKKLSAIGRTSTASPGIGSEKSKMRTSSVSYTPITGTAGCLRSPTPKPSTKRWSRFWTEKTVRCDGGASQPLGGWVGWRLCDQGFSRGRITRRFGPGTIFNRGSPITPSSMRTTTANVNTRRRWKTSPTPRGGWNENTLCQRTGHFRFYRWLSDHNCSEIENSDDRGGIRGELWLRRAFDSLGFKRTEEE